MNAKKSTPDPRAFAQVLGHKTKGRLIDVANTPGLTFSDSEARRLYECGLAKPKRPSEAWTPMQLTDFGCAVLRELDATGGAS